MKRGFLVFNPSAGQRKKTNGRIADVLREFEKNGLEISPCPTKPNGSAIQQVADLVKQNPDLIVAWGGDGTFNEILNGMYGSGIPLGILPGGTANVLARELKIPFELQEAIRIVAAGKVRTVSIGQANKRYFLLMTGVGFDSKVIQNVDDTLKRKYGKTAFGVSALRTAGSYTYPVFEVKADGQGKECVFAVVSNVRRYAAFFDLCPDADIFDEYLHVCLFKEAGLANMFRYAFHVWNHTHRKLPSVELLRASEVEISGGSEIAVQLDGELAGSLPVKLTIHSSAFPLICP